MITAQDDFFSRLDEITDFDQVVVADSHKPADPSWHVVITDVRGSTAAIEAGRYKEVNALGVASIVALRNALPDVELPYVFGGDGATVLVPGTRIAEVEVALRGVRRMAREAFAMDLRVAHVPIAELLRHGHDVRVGRYRLSRHVVLAAFSGAGFSVAERWIKDPQRGQAFAIDDEGSAHADLAGFECRWRPARSRRGRIVSLLIVATGPDPERRQRAYQDVLAHLARIVAADAAKPVSAERLQLASVTADFSTEARVVSGRASGPEFQRAHRTARTAALVGKGLLATRLKAGSFNGATYKSELLENTDFRKFDDALRMVLDLSDDELAAVERHLDAAHHDRVLAYGLHRSEEALITCMVGSYAGNHVHFIDGANGGYALAAKALKQRLRSMSSEWPERQNRGSPP